MTGVFQLDEPCLDCYFPATCFFLLALFPKLQALPTSELLAFPSRALGSCLDRHVLRASLLVYLQMPHATISLHVRGVLSPGILIDDPVARDGEGLGQDLRRLLGQYPACDNDLTSRSFISAGGAALFCLHPTQTGLLHRGRREVGLASLPLPTFGPPLPASVFSPPLPVSP